MESEDSSDSIPEVPDGAVGAGRKDARDFFHQCNVKDTLQVLSLKNLEFKVLALAEKETRLFWTVNSLRSYVDCERVPRGLRAYKEPSQFSDDPEFVHTWKNIHQEYCMQMLRAVIDRNEQEYTKVTEELLKTKTELRTRLDEEKFHTFSKKMERKIVALQSIIKDQKKDKFIRDRLDYESEKVFPVGGPKKQRPRRPRGGQIRRRTTDYWTTESDSSGNEDSNRKARKDDSEKQKTSKENQDQKDQETASNSKKMDSNNKKTSGPLGGKHEGDLEGKGEEDLGRPKRSTQRNKKVSWNK
ncbi:regulator of nonsense transcripts 3B-like isoform X2 [Hyla sarda]|uniref:regulator of nonsense transcripts 3B-like isoform X2 n=1 Tax=Hyla sarda TaxID=327740 RepID=UPI0024C40F29|nr:regulator of nonsense transcripts 3B-like isoform X2 [Hyla sarda]